MFKTKRRKELEKKEWELRKLELRINDLKYWCAEECPEISFAMIYLEEDVANISEFREELRSGKLTIKELRKHI